MEIFNKGVLINYWGEIYLGLIENWITPERTLQFCQQDKVIPCTEKKLIDLYIALDESYHTFLESIIEFSRNNNEAEISFNPDSLNDIRKNIPYTYTEIWQLEFLLEAINSSESKEKTLSKVLDLFVLFNYPNSWKPFIINQPLYEIQSFGKGDAFENLIFYTKELEDLIKNRK